MAPAHLVAFDEDVQRRDAMAERQRRSASGGDVVERCVVCFHDREVGDEDVVLASVRRVVRETRHDRPRECDEGIRGLRRRPHDARESLDPGELDIEWLMRCGDRRELAPHVRVQPGSGHERVDHRDVGGNAPCGGPIPARTNAVQRPWHRDPDDDGALGLGRRHGRQGTLPLMSTVSAILARRARPALIVLTAIVLAACAAPPASEAPATSRPVAPVRTLQPLATPAPVDPESGLPVIALAALPPEAAGTVALIDTDGPFPYDQDGAIFENREGLLPTRERGFYREYTVLTPGSDDRGARRIVAGADGEMYWTSDHYDSFAWIER
jgi:ribonuclease T1